MDTNFLVGYTGAYQDPVTEGYPLGDGYWMYLPELFGSIRRLSTCHPDLLHSWIRFVVKF